MKRMSTPLLVALALCGVVTFPAFAGPVANVAVSADGITWQPVASDRALTLTVSGPDGFYLRQEVAAGQAPEFGVFDGAGNHRPSGVYVWELRSAGRIDDARRSALDEVRESGDAAALTKAARASDDGGYQSASFSILDGQIVAGGSEGEAPATGDEGNRLSRKVVLTNANGVIRNALCVGADCPDAPAFGDSSVLMMENNNRIKFGDTSASPFPNNDWEIEANSSVSGGLSYLGFNDCGPNDNDGDCATDLVFAVEAGARASALYVESDGDVGLGTANPVLDLHIVTGNTPALRLEQDSSAGFTAQTWDVAGNEASFFVRDVTSGSRLPFRIRPGALSNSLVIDSDSDVGIGTLSPNADLNVVQTDATTGFHLERAGNPVTMLFSDTTAGKSWEFKINAAGDFAINDPSAAGGEMTLTSAGNLTIKGMLTEGSSRTIKSGFEAVDGREVLARVAAMPVSTWVYTGGTARHIGPMAEDFHASFGLGADAEHIAPGDKAGVALAAIQGLHQVVEEKDRQIEDLRSEVEELKRLVRELAEE